MIVATHQRPAMSESITRREFAALAATTAAVSLLPQRVLAAPVWAGYEHAIVIDNLATPGPFNVPNSYARPWTAEMVANAKASGITAVNVTVGMPGADPFEGTVKALAFIGREIDRHPDAFMSIRTVADIRRAKEARKVGLIAGFQDTTMLASDIDRVDLFHGLGVRIIQLTYNGSNLVGDGCLAPGNAGLTPFGRSVVGRMNERGVLVDLSHCGRRTTTEAIALSTKPVGITHSGCAGLNDVPRNKTDQQLKAMADKGGVIGIYTMPFLRASGQPTADDFVRHIEHAVRVCGEDHVGVGTDNSITPLNLTPEFRVEHAGFVRQRRSAGVSAPGEDENVFNYVPDFNSPRRMEQIADALAARGHTSARIEKILGQNWLRVFGETWMK
jgi:membrane dipeptidase